MAWQILCSSTRCCWGILEYHGNESLLASLEAVLGFARIMTWKGTHPVVELVATTDRTGVQLTTVTLGKVLCGHSLSRLSLTGYLGHVIMVGSLTVGGSSVQEE